ncbi:MAG: glycosyltransferase family 39 protein [Anaerolineae bacterium]|nr:glycosyltransferase family 39 protein [Anaerolineae bacterium]
MNRLCTSSNRRWTDWIAFAGLLLLAYALRAGDLISDVPLHPDEALFSTYARRAALGGDWLLHGDLDKPPLSLYAAAISMSAFAAQPGSGVLDFTPQQGVFAARLPGLFFSLITASAITALGSRLYGQARRGWWAGLLFAASPLAIRYGATAFTDGLMLCAGVLAALAAARDRWGWAGFWMGASCCAKFQAIFLFPFIVALGWGTGALSKRRGVHLALTFGAWLLALIVWDMLRAQPTGVLELASAHNPVFRLIRSDEIAPRLLQWGEHGLMVHGVAVAALLPLAILGGRNQPVRNRLLDRLGVIYGLLYVAAHWLVAFDDYERYALPLLLPTCLILSRGIAPLARMPQGSRLAGAFAALVAGVGILGVTWGFPSGGSNREAARHPGVEAAAAALNDKPVAAVLYDHWLGWELDYYLGEWTNKRRVYYPTPSSLADGAAQLDEQSSRYFVVPAEQNVTLWLEALASKGFVATVEAQFEQVLIYRLEPPP